MVKCRTSCPMVFVTLPTKKRTVKVSRGKQNGLYNNMGALEDPGHGWRIQTSCHCTRIFLDHLNDLFNFYGCILERLHWLALVPGTARVLKMTGVPFGGIAGWWRWWVAGVPGVPGWPGSRELRGLRPRGHGDEREERIRLTEFRFLLMGIRKSLNCRNIRWNGLTQACRATRMVTSCSKGAIASSPRQFIKPEVTSYSLPHEIVVLGIHAPPLHPIYSQRRSFSSFLFPDENVDSLPRTRRPIRSSASGNINFGSVNDLIELASLRNSVVLMATIGPSAAMAVSVSGNGGSWNPSKPRSYRV